MTGPSAGSVQGRRIRVLWNPASGRKAGIPTNTASRDSLVDLMARFELGDELIETESEEHTLALVREAVEAHYDTVVAAGGDGSMGLVAGELLDTDTALGILPLGSIMNIPRMLDLPRYLDAAAQILRDGHVRVIDVGQSGDTLFYEAASVGLHAAVFRTWRRWTRATSPLSPTRSSRHSATDHRA
ncbi:MAG: acylglycerol kinase family protein [Chloroflexi bacterium]|nr:acylglycerol kinase family protein [Chloroflexota bacterium]